MAQHASAMLRGARRPQSCQLKNGRGSPAPARLCKERNPDAAAGPPGSVSSVRAMRWGALGDPAPWNNKRRNNLTDQGGPVSQCAAHMQQRVRPGNRGALLQAFERAQRLANG